MAMYVIYHRYITDNVPKKLIVISKHHLNFWRYHLQKNFLLQNPHKKCIFFLIIKNIYFCLKICVKIIICAILKPKRCCMRNAQFEVRDCMRMLRFEVRDYMKNVRFKVRLHEKCAVWSTIILNLKIMLWTINVPCSRTSNCTLFMQSRTLNSNIFMHSRISNCAFLMQPYFKLHLFHAVTYFE